MHPEDCKAEYETYREIMDELLEPIRGEGLDVDTLARLYESKLVYLKNLRVKCFYSLNRKSENLFTTDDLGLILRAVEETKANLKELVLLVVSARLARRKVS